MNDKPVSGYKRGVQKYSLHDNSSEIDQEKSVFLLEGIPAFNYNVDLNWW